MCTLHAHRLLVRTSCPGSGQRCATTYRRIIYAVKQASIKSCLYNLHVELYIQEKRASVAHYSTVNTYACFKSDVLRTDIDDHLQVILNRSSLWVRASQKALIIYSVLTRSIHSKEVPFFRREFVSIWNWSVIKSLKVMGK